MTLDRALRQLATAGRYPPCAAPSAGGLWLAEDRAVRAVAARLCTSCPVVAECAAAADSREETFGVWGGVDRTPVQRRRSRAGVARPETDPTDTTEPEVTMTSPNHAARDASAGDHPAPNRAPHETAGGQSSSWELIEAVGDLFDPRAAATASPRPGSPGAPSMARRIAAANAAPAASTPRPTRTDRRNRAGHTTTRRNKIMTDLKAFFGTPAQIVDQQQHQQNLPGLYSDLEDSSALPDDYQGAPPPPGWCSNGTTYYVPDELRAAYLSQLNDPDAELLRRETSLVELSQASQIGGVMVKVPDRMDPRRPDSDQASTGENYWRVFHLQIGNPEHHRINEHLFRLADARTTVESTQRDFEAQARSVMFRNARTCHVCHAGSVTELPISTTVPGELRLCPDCEATATYARAYQLAAQQITDTNGRSCNRGEAIARLLDTTGARDAGELTA